MKPNPATPLALLTLAATASIANAALTATNLSFEDSTDSSAPPQDWTSSSGNAFRPANSGPWFQPANPAERGSNELLIDFGGSSGTLSQQLTGTAEVGTYTWNIFDVGTATFGDTAGGGFTFGFSADGSTFLAGASKTLIAGTDLFAPGSGNPAIDDSVSFTVNAGNVGDNLFLLIESVNNPGRTTSTISHTELNFVAVPEPSSTALLGLGGLALIMRRRK